MRSSKALLNKADWLWLLGYPLYQTVGTLRHEAGHALAAWLEGSTILEFVFWPTITRGVLLWGYVRSTGPTTWVSLAAPYIADLLTFALFFWICGRIRAPRRALWLNLVIVGLASPLLNSAYNYVGSFSFRRGNDVGRLMFHLDELTVHAYFLLTITLYAAGLWVALKRGSARHQHSTSLTPTRTLAESAATPGLR